MCLAAKRAKLSSWLLQLSLGFVASYIFFFFLSKSIHNFVREGGPRPIILKF